MGRAGRPKIEVVLLSIMRDMLRRLTLGLIFIAALSACGGGGSAGSSVPRTGPTAAASPASSSRVVVSIAIPAAASTSTAARRRPLYVSDNTQSAAIAINGGTPVTVNLSVTSPNCTTAADGARTCTTTVNAPVGSDTFAETLYASTNATGAVLSQGQTQATIVAGKANTVALTLGGVIASLGLSLATSAPTEGTPLPIGLTVNFYDASGASIIGSAPFVTPVTLSDSDASGATSLSKLTLSSPTDVVSLVVNYSGVARTQAVIGASAGTIVAPSVTLTSQAASAPAFNDYVTFGYDNQRDVFNPNSTTITPTAIASLHLAWQAALGGGDFNTQTQPILATEFPGHAGVLFVGGGTGNVYGYDATTGALLWRTPLGQETYQCENGNTIYFGVGGTVAYDPASKSLYAIGNSKTSSDAVATNALFHLDGSSGAILGQVNFAPAAPGWNALNFSHTAVTLGSNGLAYVGTAATCDISSWIGRVAAVSVPAMSLANTFYPVWDPQNTRGGGAQPWGGGGIWGWGGVSLDFGGNVLTGVGNTDSGNTEHGAVVAPFVAAPAENSGLGEAFTKISADLSTLEASNQPIPSSQYSGNSQDLDLNGTPVVFQPNGAGCDPMAALQGKSGAVYLYDTARIGQGPIAQYQLAPSTYADGFLGDPAYSPATGLLYVDVPSSNGSLYAPGMIAINPGCGNPSVTWHTAFGPDSYAPGSDLSPGEARSVPAVSAGGVVFVGTICTPSGNGCGATTTSSAARKTQGSVRKPLICCAPPGGGGGAVWALDASSGAVLNGGNPIIITAAPLRVPPTIDGDWIFVLDNAGNMYALTLDPKYTATSTKQRSVDARMLKTWESPPKR